MVVELKLCKTDNRKFGFRLVGGADFETPLTVSMVMEGSVAEEAGMRVGDVVVRINDIPTTPLSHQEAHEVLTKAGNNFCVGVLRERDLTPCGASPCPTTASDPLDFADDYRNEVLSFPKDPSLVTDDDIAEMISGEAEVLKDHNVIGVNFNKLIPTAEPQPEPEKEPTPPPEEEKYDIPEDANAEHLGPHSEQEFEKIQKEVDKHEEDWEDKFEKKPAEIEENFNISSDPKANLQAELKQKLKPKAEKRLKSAFGPLTPQQRPIFLKGRMWKRPEDAYNEDFIAEVISSQAELIKGSTLGVNFLKYQKPEKDISFIKNSETYRLIHGLDNTPSCGISNRPEIIPAEADIKRCATPCQ